MSDLIITEQHKKSYALNLTNRKVFLDINEEKYSEELNNNIKKSNTQILSYILNEIEKYKDYFNIWELHYMKEEKRRSWEDETKTLFYKKYVELFDITKDSENLDQSCSYFYSLIFVINDVKINSNKEEIEKYSKQLKNAKVIMQERFGKEKTQKYLEDDYKDWVESYKEYEKEMKNFDDIKDCPNIFYEFLVKD
jgi:hypothetical protein